MSYQGHRRLSLASTRNELIRHCFLRWQEERLSSAVQCLEGRSTEFLFNLQFPRVPTSVCVVMEKIPDAQNFSVSPKKPILNIPPLPDKSGNWPPRSKEEFFYGKKNAHI